MERTYNGGVDAQATGPFGVIFSIDAGCRRECRFWAASRTDVEDFAHQIRLERTIELA